MEQVLQRLVETHVDNRSPSARRPHEVHDDATDGVRADVGRGDLHDPPSGANARTLRVFAWSPPSGGLELDEPCHAPAFQA